MNFEFTELIVRPSNNRKGESFRDKHKIYIFHDKESIIDNIIERHNRPYETYKELVLPKLMELLDFKFPSHHASVMKEKWSWRQNCGCSVCPCSPGFVGNNGVVIPLDIFVTIKIN